MDDEDVRLSVWEKLATVTVYLRLFGTLVISVVKYPFKGKRGGSTFRSYVSRNLSRVLLESMSLRQLQALVPQSAVVPDYQKFCSKVGIESKVTKSSTGVKRFWIGDENARNVLFWIPGGGYVLPIAAAHFEFLWRLKASLPGKGRDFAIVTVSYRLAPRHKYPTQLEDCLEVFRELLESHSPDQITLGGDSAGAALALALETHIRHPHPSIEPLTIDGDFAGLILVSPWGDSEHNHPSWKRNLDTDFLNPTLLDIWLKAYVGSKEFDAYTTPASSRSPGWHGIRVRRVIVTVGDEEGLLDTGLALAQKLQASQTETTLVVGRGHPHDCVIFDYNLGAKEPSEQVRAIQSWVASGLAS